MENLIKTYFQAFSNKDIHELEGLFSNEIILKDEQIRDLEKIAPISEKEGWNEIKRFSGSSTRTTEPFYINSNLWRITYNFSLGDGVSDRGVLNIMAVNVTNSMPVAVTVSQETNKIESSYVYYGNSDFYLSISTANAVYEIIIEAFNEV